MAAKRTGQPQLPLPAAVDLRQTLAKNLRAARLEQGLSQRSLAALSGISRDYIGRLEKHLDANPSLDVIAALGRHVNRTPIQLLTASEPSTRRRE
jgi:transcriptional regulator with XRE-family HTH domain